MSDNNFRGVFFRGLASLIDGIIEISILVICYWLVVLQPEKDPSNFIIILACLFGVFTIFCYEFVFTASYLQGTLGKVFFSCYVGNLDGERISKKRSFARFFAKGLMFSTGILCLVSVLVTLFSKEKASLHDRICNTRVFVGSKI